MIAYLANAIQLGTDQSTKLILVLLSSLLIAFSVVFGFWPILVGVAAVIVCLLQYRTAFAFVLSSSFLVAAMDIQNHDIWIGLRWLILGLAAFSSMILFAEYPELMRKSNLKTFHLLAFSTVVVAIFSLAVSVSPLMTLLKSLTLLALFTYCLIGVRLTLKKHETFFVGGITAWSEFLVYLCFFSYTIFDYPLFENPNTLGGLIGIACWPLLFARLICERTRMGFLRYSIALTICGYMLFTSQSRASILGAGIASLFILLSLRRVLLTVAAASILAGTILAFAAYQPDQFESQVQQLLVKHPEYTTTFAARQDLWLEGMLKIRTRPWFGGGFGVSAGLSEGWKTSVSSEDANREKGNSYLALIEELGFVGAAVPFCLIGALLWRIGSLLSKKDISVVSRTATIPIAAVLLSGLVNAFFEAWLFAVGSYITVFFWILAFAFMDLRGISGRAANTAVTQVEQA